MVHSKLLAFVLLIFFSISLGATKKLNHFFREPENLKKLIIGPDGKLNFGENKKQKPKLALLDHLKKQRDEIKKNPKEWFNTKILRKKPQPKLSKLKKYYKQFCKNPLMKIDTFLKKFDPKKPTHICTEDFYGTFEIFDRFRPTSTRPKIKKRKKAPRCIYISNPDGTFERISFEENPNNEPSIVKSASSLSEQQLINEYDNIHEKEIVNLIQNLCLNKFQKGLVRSGVEWYIFRTLKSLGIDPPNVTKEILHQTYENAIAEKTTREKLLNCNNRYKEELKKHNYHLAIKNIKTNPKELMDIIVKVAGSLKSENGLNLDIILISMFNASRPSNFL